MVDRVVWLCQSQGMDHIRDYDPNTGQKSGAGDAVARTIGVLDLVSSRSDLTSARQIAGELGLPKSSAYRIVQSLQQTGAIEYDAESGSFRLGPSIARIGIQALGGLGVRQLARRFLEDLVQSTNETASLSVRFGDTRTYVDVVESPNILSARPPIGRPLPLLVGAPGRALSFPLADEEILGLLKRTALYSYTTNTPVSPEEVWEGIEEARARGYAVARDEVISGLATISAPVFAEDGTVAAAISVAGPSTRLSAEQLTDLAEPLWAATKAMAAELTDRSFS